MIRAVYPGLPPDKKNLEWLSHALRAAIKEYKTVWIGKDRLTPTGLSRYAGFDEGIPPEVESGHFNEVLKPFAIKHKKTIPDLMEEFNRGKIKDPELIEFFYQDRALRESGHDTTFRFRTEGKDRAADFVTVDLNSLLYKYELDIAYLIDQYFEGNFEQQTAQHFYQAALKRRELMKKFLWNEEKGLFFDYNWKEGKISSYLSATTLYPLWAGHGHEERFKMLTMTEAKRLLTNALKELEQNGGLSATAEASLKKFGDSKIERQWDYPNGWAPHQILAWIGLKEYGFHQDAHRLIYKWLYMITRNFRDYHGTIPEKYNVVTMSHKVFSEYGNVGTKFSYITLEGFGWMNASYQLGLKELPGPMQTRLKNLMPPEWLRSEDAAETH
jgi:alpha,alpha-trehalase